MNSLARSLSQLSLKLTPMVSQNMVAHRYSAQRIVKRKPKPLNKAICLYMERSKAHEERLLKESELYIKGKRYLAMMMGEDPSTFTQQDVDKAINYLLPSGLSEKVARPVMKPPEEIYPEIRAAAFDMHGRPFHYLFYTKYPEAYEIQHEAAKRLRDLDIELDNLHLKKKHPVPENKFDPTGSEWKSAAVMQSEGIYRVERKYEGVIAVLERLAQHPMSASVTDFLMKYRRVLPSVADSLEMKKPQALPDNRYLSEEKAGRKTSKAVVKVYSPGKGDIIINQHQDLAYFTDIQAREQVLSPLLLTNMLGEVDVEVRVHGGGENSQAGAIKHGIAKALRPFLSQEMLVKLTLSGFLTRDPRKKERKKPGKQRARRGYTWLKR